MPYNVNQLAKLAGISVRTLHHYDQIGLLTPRRIQSNGYRQYEEDELLKLQQILFFRELDFPLLEIKRILTSPSFDMREALEDQRKLIELKKKRLSGLMATIDKTIKKINNEITMDDKDLYGTFSKEEADQYAAEAKERWGHTEAYKQSQERVKKMTKADWARMSEETDAIMKGLVANMDKGPKSDEILPLIARHHNSLRNF
jgi:DNA-binding transcriptional MerR regulator